MSLSDDDGGPEGGDQRCCCGRLLAVRTASGYEIRCGRCKTVQILPLVPPDDAAHEEELTH